jgi:hypothetical protein
LLQVSRRIWTIDALQFPIRSIFKEQKVSSTANMLAAAGVVLTAKICEKVDGLTSWIEFFAEVFDKCRVYNL